MKRILTIILVLVFSFSSQAQQFQWAKQIGGIGGDVGSCITTDATGNVYSTGGFYADTIDADPGLGIHKFGSAGGWDTYIQKLDAAGNLIWARQISGTLDNYANAISVDAIGNVYTAGWFKGTVDFDPGLGIFNLTSTGNDDIYVQKLDTAGNFLWAKRMGSTQRDIAWSMIVDATGNVYTSGTFQGTVDFDPGPSISNLTYLGNEDVFIQKLDAYGNFVWVKRIGGSGYDYGLSISLDVFGNVYSTGYFDGTVDFDPGLGVFNLTSANNSSNVFIEKLDGTGNFIWAKKFGGLGSDAGQAISIDAWGNIFTTGYFDGTADFDPGTGIFNLTSAGNFDIYLQKLDASGNFLWAKHWGGPNLDVARSISVDEYGNVYTTGQFIDTVDFDPGVGVFKLYQTSGTYGVFIEKLDSLGNFSWVKQLGGATGGGTGYSIYASIDDNIYTTGWFTDTANFGFGTSINNLTTLGGSDVYVYKIGQSNFSVIKYPSILLSKSDLDTGQILTINGRNFTQGQSTEITISTLGGTRIFDQFVPVNNFGRFNLDWKVPGNVSSGWYNVNATDTCSKQNVAPKRIKISIPGLQPTTNISIQSPLSINQYYAGSMVYIQWSDKITTYQFTTSISGEAKRTYNIEYSLNGGAWQFIGNYTGTAHLNELKYFPSYQFAPITDGSYRIRISDASNAVYDKVSETFTVIQPAGIGFDYSKIWDFTDKVPNEPPLGVCADGTARIYLKVNKKSTNSKTISNVVVTLSDPITGSTDIALLGKVMVATKVTGYDIEGDYANAISVTNSSPISGDYWFWYVAPEDYNRSSSVDNYTGKRIVKADIKVLYTDNSQDVIQTDIEIVRPPIMFVHGLGGNEHTWDDLVYTNSGIDYRFMYPSPIFPAGIRTNNMLPNASFIDNANILLGNQKNSFKEILHLSRFSRRYAAAKVDYICHSMGGSMGRTAINKFPTKYYANENYSKGFINKFISLNTPHNGSPVADFVADNIPNCTFFARSRLSLYYRELSHYIKPVAPYKLGVPSYVPTDAILDLQSFRGGITFNPTNVKNHLIGSNINSTSLHLKTVLYSIAGNIDILLFIASGFDMMYYISSKSPYSDFIYKSDIVVPVSSQFAGGNTFQSTDPRTLFNGLSYLHTSVPEKPDIGNRVLELLNTSINSSLFANSIPKNSINQNGTVYKTTGIVMSEYFDTIKIKITSLPSSVLRVDSILSLQINIKDTINLKQVSLLFQGETFEGSNHEYLQEIKIRINPNFIDSQAIIVSTLYDSSGYDVFHYDIIKVKVVTDGLPLNVAVTPKTKALFRNQDYTPSLNGIHNSYITSISLDNPNVALSIADTSVMHFDKSTYRFIANDTGSTFAIFTYNGLKDSIFFYVDDIDTTTTNSVVQNNTNGNSNENQLYIYPNPTNANFSIKMESTKDENITIEVYNALGQKISLIKDVSYSEVYTRIISLKECTSGLYYIKAKSGNKTYSGSVVLTK